MAPTPMLKRSMLTRSTTCSKTSNSALHRRKAAKGPPGCRRHQALILRLLDGELLSGDELEELRGGIGGLSKILKFYNDYQTALERAQPARTILDQLLKS
jgi:hypothetical protein